MVLLSSNVEDAWQQTKLSTIILSYAILGQVVQSWVKITQG